MYNSVTIQSSCVIMRIYSIPNFKDAIPCYSIVAVPTLLPLRIFRGRPQAAAALKSDTTSSFEHFLILTSRTKRGPLRTHFLTYIVYCIFFSRGAPSGGPKRFWRCQVLMVSRVTKHSRSLVITQQATQTGFADNGERAPLGYY